MLTEIERRLEALRKMQQLRDDAWKSYQDALLEAVPLEVREAQDAVESEYMPMLERMDADIAETENEVKAAVAKHGQTVSAAGLMAQYSKGRVTYDAKRLDGLALAFPQINECKKTGDPYVVLKPVKG